MKKVEAYNNLSHVNTFAYFLFLNFQTSSV